MVNGPADTLDIEGAKEEACDFKNRHQPEDSVQREGEVPKSPHDGSKDASIDEVPSFDLEVLEINKYLQYLDVKTDVMGTEKAESNEEGVETEEDSVRLKGDKVLLVPFNEFVLDPPILEKSSSFDSLVSLGVSKYLKYLDPKDNCTKPMVTGQGIMVSKKEDVENVLIEVVKEKNTETNHRSEDSFINSDEFAKSSISEVLSFDSEVSLGINKYLQYLDPVQTGSEPPEKTPWWLISGEKETENLTIEGQGEETVLDKIYHSEHSSLQESNIQKSSPDEALGDGAIMDVSSFDSEASLGINKYLQYLDLVEENGIESLESQQEDTSCRLVVSQEESLEALNQQIEVFEEAIETLSCAASDCSSTLRLSESPSDESLGINKYLKYLDTAPSASNEETYEKSVEFAEIDSEAYVPILLNDSMPDIIEGVDDTCVPGDIFNIAKDLRYINSNPCGSECQDVHSLGRTKTDITSDETVTYIGEHDATMVSLSVSSDETPPHLKNKLAVAAKEANQENVKMKAMQIIRRLPWVMESSYHLVRSTIPVLQFIGLTLFLTAGNSLGFNLKKR